MVDESHKEEDASRGRPSEPSEQGEANDNANSTRTSPGSLWREVWVVFGVSVVLTGILSVVPLGEYTAVLVALVFLGLPTLVAIRYRKEDPDAAGMHYGSWRRGVVWGVLGGVVVLVPFAVGFHVWSVHVEGRTSSWQMENYWRFPLELEGRPEAVESGQAGVYVWTERGRLRLWWSDRLGLRVVLSAEGGVLEVSQLQGAVMETREEGTAVDLNARARRGGAVVRLVGRGDGRLKVGFERGGQALNGGDVRLGYGGQASKGVPLELELGLWWLLSMLLTQLIFVGLPEEYFYRGYVQPTLERVYPERRLGWGRVGLSVAVVLGSVMFALGHFLIDPRPARLAVFFPSLLFGMMRERTGGLIGPVIFHALCNVMVEFVAVHYV